MQKGRKGRAKEHRPMESKELDSSSALHLIGSLLVKLWGNSDAAFTLEDIRDVT
ncbi:hypothetical protein NQZ68_025759 [Dissostichus eleginoides]|nr:hypothetical protein NQZ68_025759 [Dissostichus eleginoides]